MEHLVVSEIGRHGYIAIFLLMLVESVCIPIPSEVIMLFGGALSAGVLIVGTSIHLNFFIVALLGALGNLIGSLIAYFIGRTGGRAAVERWGKYVFIKHRDVDKAEKFFRKNGDWAVFIGRLLPVVRTFVSLPAGIAEMNVYKFALFTFAGCLPWTFVLALIGRALASNWQSLSRFSTPISICIAAVIVILFCWWITNRYKLSRAGKA